MSFKLEAGTFTGLMTTELNSLASGSGIIGNTVYDNSLTANLWMWGMLELIVTFGVAPTAGRVIEVYLIPATDGTNYADASNTTPPYGLLAGAWPVQASTSQQRIVTPYAPLSPVPFKPFVRNQTDQAFAASGNIVSIKPYREQ